MNNTNVKLFSLSLSLLLLGAGCLGSNVAVDNAEQGDASKTAGAEARLGIALPADSAVTSVIENATTYSASMLTSLSVNDAEVYFAETLEEDGYTPKRRFGSLPTDNAERTSATYQKGSSVISVNITTNGEKTEVSIQQQ